MTLEEKINSHEKRIPIPHTLFYEIDQHGFVYRKGKKLKLSKRGPKWYAQIYDKDKRKHVVNSEALARRLFGEEEYILKRQEIEDNFNVRVIPDFPRYMITPYGAVYCVDPPKRGRRAGECYLLRINQTTRKPTVTLYLADGRRRTRYVDKLVEQAWG
jgi:hypothetical protein|tara:strand:- start:526 stop:999 length:474 start_codon:yes stop_codon:yes gene_type:complete